MMCTCVQSWTSAKKVVEEGANGEGVFTSDYTFFLISNDSSETSKICDLRPSLVEIYGGVRFLYDLVNCDDYYKNLIGCFCNSKPRITHNVLCM